MKTYHDVLYDLQTLAKQRGWYATQVLISRLLDVPSTSFLIVSLDKAADPIAFRNELTLASIDSPPEVTTLEQILENPLPIVSSSKVIGIFPCGQFVPPEVVTLLNETLFLRPAGSYAIVLTDSNVIASDSDLEAVEKIAWGVLVKDAKHAWERQTLQAEKVYLWGQGADWLMPRLESDRSALLAWVRDSISATAKEELATAQARYAIAFASREAYGQGEPEPKPSADMAQPYLEAQTSLLELKTRMLHWLHEDAQLATTQLNGALDTLERKLRQDLRPFLQVQLPGRRVSTQDLGILLQRYIQEIENRWRQETIRNIRQYRIETATNIQPMTRHVPWELVNSCLPPHSGDYPTRFLQILKQPLPDSATAGNNVYTAPTSLPPQDNTTADASHLLLGASLGAGAGALISMFLPLGIIGISVGGAAGVLLARYTYQRSQKHSIETAVHIANDLIRTAVETQRAKIYSIVTNDEQQVQKYLEQEFTLVVEALGATILKQQNEPQQPEEDTLTQLTGLLERLA